VPWPLSQARWRESRDGARRSPAVAQVVWFRAMRIRWGWLLIACAFSTAASAEVVRVEVATRNDVAGGKAYGNAGPYERMVGTLHFAVDPRERVNQIVADIGYAPTNADGRVEFRADFYLLKPKDAKRGNGALLFEVSNRGGKGILPMIAHGAASPAPAAANELGDGFLLDQGFCILWVGWQFDPPPGAPDLLRVYAPTATDHGAPLEGWVRSDFIVRQRALDQSLGDGDHVAYAPADPESDANTLTVRDRPLDARQPIPHDRWRFAAATPSGASTPAAPRIYLDGGFDPNRIYEVVYRSENPPVAGLGLAAIRDAVSALKYEGVRELDISAGALDRATGFGISQSGRVLRTFLYDGFNEDERHRKVFDGVMAHIAGGARGGFNLRFAQPSRSSSSYFHPNDIFPFTDAEQTDAATGATDGLLAKVAPPFVPKIFYTNSSNEYWRGHAALTHVTLDGKRDLPPIATTRIYHFAGTQHGPASQFPPPRASGQLPNNPNDYSWFLRSLVLKMDRWIAKGDAPPASRYPTLAAKTLVERGALAFPTIPGVAVPTRLLGAMRLDYGPQFATARVRTIEPPVVGAAFPLLLPQVDADGNETDGLRSPELAVPLATYTGWSLYDARFGRDDELVALQGSFIPLPPDEEQRELNHDPRLSIAGRYRDAEHYVELVAEHARPLVAQGYVRAEDVAQILERAREHWTRLVERP
jgi:hypothetical protein